MLGKGVQALPTSFPAFAGFSFAPPALLEGNGAAGLAGSAGPAQASAPPAASPAKRLGLEPAAIGTASSGVSTLPPTFTNGFPAFSFSSTTSLQPSSPAAKAPAAASAAAPVFSFGMTTLPLPTPADGPFTFASTPAAPLPFSSLGAAGGGVPAHPLHVGGGGAAPVLGSLRAAVKTPTAKMSPARVVELMRAGGGDERVAEAGAIALRAIVPKKGTQPCVDAGAVPVLVAALRTHASVPAVAEKACRALVNIAGIPAGQDACVSEGAVPAIVAALRTHASEPAVVQYACWALANIAMSPAMSPAGQNTSAAGAVPAIVAVLRTHAREPAEAEWACWALVNIADIPGGQDACVSEGAVPALVAALRAHASMPAVVESASCALLNIGCANPSHRAAIVAAGAAPLLAEAFSAHTGEARQNAHEALDKLGYTDEGVSKETAAAACDAAAAAMYARISSTRGELGPIVRFAGGPEAEWSCGLFRTLRYELLPMFNTEEANVSKLQKEAPSLPFHPHLRSLTQSKHNTFTAPPNCWCCYDRPCAWCARSSSGRWRSTPGRTWRL
jgi:hypothetical protein